MFNLSLQHKNLIQKTLFVLVLGLLFSGIFYIQSDTTPVVEAVHTCILGSVQGNNTGGNYCPTYYTLPACGGNAGNTVSTPTTPCRPTSDFCFFDVEPPSSTSYNIITSCTPLAHGTPEITVTPASQGFGNVFTGSYATRSFVVENTGTGTLQGSVSGLAGDFSCSSNCSGWTIDAGNTLTVSIRYTPGGVGADSDTAIFNCPTCSNGPINRAVSGSGVLPTGGVSYTNYLDAGSIRADSFQTRMTATWPTTVSPGEVFDVDASVMCGGDDYSGSHDVGGFLSGPNEAFPGNYRTINCPSGGGSGSIGSLSITAPMIPGIYNRNFYVSRSGPSLIPEVLTEMTVQGTIQYEVVGGPLCPMMSTADFNDTYGQTCAGPLDGCDADNIDVECRANPEWGCFPNIECPAPVCTTGDWVVLGFGPAFPAWDTCEFSTLGENALIDMEPANSVSSFTAPCRDYMCIDCMMDVITYKGSPRRYVDVTCDGTPPPDPACSDGGDNDGDLLIDTDDPGCHTDGNAGNAGSYDPGDNDETDEAALDPPVVDLKVNNFDAPPAVTDGDLVTISWDNSSGGVPSSCSGDGTENSGWNHVVPGGDLITGSDPTQFDTTGFGGQTLNFTLDCTNGDGPGSETVSLVVNAPGNNAPSVPTVTGPAAATVGSSETYTISGGVDPDLNNIRYRVNWINGAPITEYTAPYISSGSSDTLSHTFTAEGTYSICAQTQDDFATPSSSAYGTGANCQSVTVSAGGGPLAVVGSAIPDSGAPPLNGVDFQGSVSGGATGDIEWSYKCLTTDGWTVHSTNANETFTMSNICDYPSSGSWWGRIRAVRDGETAYDDINIDVAGIMNGSFSVTPDPGVAPQPVRFYGACNSAECGNGTRWFDVDWDWQGGAPSYDDMFSYSIGFSVVVDPAYTYPAPGDYIIYVRIRAGGNTDIDTQTIRILDPADAPVVSASVAPPSIIEGFLHDVSWSLVSGSATECTINDDTNSIFYPGPYGPNDSVSIMPPNVGPGGQNVTYTVTCHFGPLNGSDSASGFVADDAPIPACVDPGSLYTWNGLNWDDFANPTNWSPSSFSGDGYDMTNQGPIIAGPTVLSGDVTGVTASAGSYPSQAETLTCVVPTCVLGSVRGDGDLGDQATCEAGAIADTGTLVPNCPGIVGDTVTVAAWEASRGGSENACLRSNGCGVSNSFLFIDSCAGGGGGGGGGNPDRTLTVNSPGGNGVTITSVPAGYGGVTPYTVNGIPDGATISLTREHVAPNGNYADLTTGFNGWTGQPCEGGAVSGDLSETCGVIVMDQNRTINVNYTPPLSDCSAGWQNWRHLEGYVAATDFYDDAVYSYGRDECEFECELAGADFCGWSFEQEDCPGGSCNQWNNCEFYTNPAAVIVPGADDPQILPGGDLVNRQIVACTPAIPLDPPIVDLKINLFDAPPAVTDGDLVTISWDNSSGGVPTGCSGDGAENSGWNYVVPGGDLIAGSDPTQFDTTGFGGQTLNFTLDCTNGDGPGSETVSLVVNAPAAPVVTLGTVHPGNVVDYDTQAELTWSAAPADRCSFIQGSGIDANDQTNQDGAGTDKFTDNITSSMPVQIRCWNGITSTDSAVLTVGARPQQPAFDIPQNTVALGGAVYTGWNNIANATQCYGYVENGSPGIAPNDWNYRNLGTANCWPPNAACAEIGPIINDPSTYTFVCENAFGNATSAPQIVNIQNPVASITALPKEVLKGRSTTVSWEALGVLGACTLDRIPYVGDLPEDALREVGLPIPVGTYLDFDFKDENSHNTGSIDEKYDYEIICPTGDIADPTIEARITISPFIPGFEEE